jgi:4-hydroxybutyrate dehydrogenase
MREILIKPQLHKFTNFKEFSEEFTLGERDLVLTNEYIYLPFIKDVGLKCQFVFLEKYGTEEPSETMLREIFADLNPERYDRIIAIGGGAVLDVGKILSLKRTGSPHDMYFKKVEILPEKEIIAIPTTCGTGSEVTNISVAIVMDENGKTTKLGLVSDHIIPGTVCLIPEFLKTLPYEPFAASAIDALIHAVESYLSPTRATMTSDLFSLKAMELILEGFRKIGEQGKDARFEYMDEFLTAATYAGFGFLQAGCATVHAMSFPLGGIYKVPHGVANYTLFGKVLEKYDAIKPDGKLSELKKTISRILGGTQAEAIRTLAALEEKILHLKPMREFGVKESDIEALADSCIKNQQRLITNSYVPLTRELILEIYKETY